MDTPHKLHNMNMDDTEDEEVKRNCFGKMHYTETSEEDGDSDEESTMSSNSIKLFVNHKPHGKGVFQPKPIVLDRIVEQREPPLKKIIHNECEFSDDEDEEEGEEDDDDEEENVHGFHNKDAELIIPSFKNEEFISERYYTTNTGSEEDADEDEEEEDGDDEEEADSESDEDGPLLNSGVLTEDDNDGEDDDDSEEESVEEDELEENSSSDSDDGDEKFESIGITNGSDQNLQLAFETLHEYVSETKGDGTHDVNIYIDVHDDESISADTIEDIIEKKDVNDILFSDDDDISNESGPIRVGTDIDEDEMISFLADQSQDSKDDISHLKRSYSKQEFNQISPEDGFIDHKRNCRRLSRKAKSLQDIVPPFLPTLSLGRSALADEEYYRAQNYNSSDDEEDDEAVDNQLAEELMDGITSNDPNGDSSPVPLLTPPASPTRFEIENSSAPDSQKIIVCEWPSNMAVDNALTAVNELRPMSPSSLEKLEEESMKREDFMTPTSMYQNRSRSISDVSSGLTPNFGNLNMTKL